MERRSICTSTKSATAPCRCWGLDQLATEWMCICAFHAHEEGGTVAGSRGDVTKVLKNRNRFVVTFGLFGVDEVVGFGPQLVFLAPQRFQVLSSLLRVFSLTSGLVLARAFSFLPAP